MDQDVDLTIIYFYFVMLSALFNNMTLENKLNELEHMVQCIECEYRRSNMHRIIYTKLANPVKLLPIDMNWVVKNEFHDSVKALLNVSAIITVFNTHKRTFIHKDERLCIELVRDIYNLLKEGLREHGCVNPPCKTGTHLTVDDVIKSTAVINQTFQK